MTSSSQAPISRNQALPQQLRFINKMIKKNNPNHSFQGYPFARGPPEINRQRSAPENNGNSPGAGGLAKRKHTRLLLACPDLLQRMYLELEALPSQRHGELAAGAEF